MRILEILDNNGLVGWSIAALAIVISIIRSGAFWVRAFRETGNASQATLMTSMHQELRRQEGLIKTLIRETGECEEKYSALLKDYRKLEKDITEMKKEMIKKRVER